ncbi:unnamed protein product, partial [Linum tenue]
VKKRSNLLGDSISVSNTNNINQETNHILCPKPRHIHPSPTIEFLKPPTYCTKHSHFDTIDDGGNEGILNVILDNNNKRTSECNEEKEGETPICNSYWCVPWCYSGSPPRRTSNPLVHDVQFIRQQMELISPLTRSNLSDKFSFVSSASSASPV